jgi:HEAT repeat protein
VIDQAPFTALLKAFPREADVKRRLAMTWELSYYNAYDAMIAPMLLEHLPREESAEVRARMYTLLGETLIHTEQTLPVLMKAAIQEELVVREKAVYALGRYTWKAKSALPLLFQCLLDRSEGTDTLRNYAMNAIHRIGVPNEAWVVPLLEKATTDPDENIQSWAKQRLASLKKNDR